MSDELTPAIPCPFCHAVPGINDVIGEYNEGCLYVRLRCPGDEECMAEGPWENVIEDNISPEGLYELAVARWNRRYESSELPEWAKDKIKEAMCKIECEIFNPSQHQRYKALAWVLSLRRDQQ